MLQVIISKVAINSLLCFIQEQIHCYIALVKGNLGNDKLRDQSERPAGNLDQSNWLLIIRM